MAVPPQANRSGETPLPRPPRSSPTAALVAEVRDGLARRPRELPGRFLADIAIAPVRRRVEQIIDDRLRRVERPLVSSWIGHHGAAAALTRLVDIVPAGATSALELLASPVTGPGMRDCVVVEETAELATEGAERYAAISVGCSVVPRVANPTMTVPVERCATTCFTLIGGALTRFSPVAGVRVLRAIRVAMTRRDVLLVGLDLRSHEARKADGVAHDELLATWHRHALTVANRELGLDFPVQHFRYQCRYDAGAKRLEAGVSCASRTHVTSPILEPFTLHADEQIRLTVQHSYGHVMLDSMLRGVGLSLHGWREAPDGSHGLATVVVHAPHDGEA